MTKNKQRKNVARAWLDGKPIQVANAGKGDFTDYTGDSPAFFDDKWDWRIKPEPKLRPWKPEEVPVGAITRLKCSQMPTWLIVNVGIYNAGIGGCADIDFNELCKSYVHSTDGGKTWGPCGVEE